MEKNLSNALFYSIREHDAASLKSFENLLFLNFFDKFQILKNSAQIRASPGINYFAILRLINVRDNQTSYDDVRKCATIRTYTSFRIKKIVKIGCIFFILECCGLDIITSESESSYCFSYCEKFWNPLKGRLSATDVLAEIFLQLIKKYKSWTFQ